MGQCKHQVCRAGSGGQSGLSAVCSTFAYIILFEIERRPRPLAPLAMPMVIESTFMSLLQIQKELWPF